MSRKIIPGRHKGIYRRINSEFKEKKINEEKKKSYINCLASFYKNK